METKLEKIREAIHEDFIVPKTSNWKQVSLKEDNTAKCKSILLNEQKVRSVIIELDKQGTDIHPLFTTKEGIKGLKIKNDYLIFALKKNKLYALLIELKSKNTGDWIKQCKAGEIVAKYILQMVNNWVKEDITFKHFSFRYILFHTNDNDVITLKNRRKKKIKPSPFKYITHDEGFLFIRKLCNKEYNLGMFCK